MQTDLQNRDNLTQPAYIIIAGQGRSGTNWLLDLLDISPLTYCRNEPQALATSPLAQLPSPTVCQVLDQGFGQQWDRSVAMTSLRMGERDRIGAYPKFYLYEPLRRLGGSAILSKRKVRQLLSFISPDLSAPDWSVPAWYTSPSVLSQALPVLKLNQVPRWASWVLHNRPQALVLHIVRHPGGFLNSWQQRYLTQRDRDTVTSANERRLRAIAETDAQWAERFGDIAAMTVEESELWYWRYANEVIYRAGQNSSNYLRIIYEELAANPLVVTQRIYEQCHLPWTQVIETEVFKVAVPAQSIAKAWYAKLSTSQIDLINRVLSGSLMSQWWE